MAAQPSEPTATSPTTMEDTQYGAATPEEPGTAQGQPSMQGSEPAQQQGQARQGQQPSLTSNGQNLPIGSVIMLKEASAPSRLLFFRDDVDCATVTETKQGPDQALVSVEVEPGTDGIPRIARSATWTINTPEQQGKAAAKGNELVVAAVPASELVEGRVMMTGKIKDSVVELNGPFTATVCEVSVTGIPVP